MMQKPSLGRVVHYTDAHGGTSAAIVTGVYDEQEGQPDRVDLSVFRAGVSGAEAVEEVPYGNELHNWFWPPRV